MPSANTKYVKARVVRVLTLLPCLLLVASTSLPLRLPGSTVSSDRLSSTPRTTNPSLQSKVAELSQSLPMSFEANGGQADGHVKFLSRGAGYCLLLAPTGATLQLVQPISADKPPTTPPATRRISDASCFSDFGFNPSQSASTVATNAVPATHSTRPPMEV